MAAQRLVLDANILLRAVLGKRVKAIILSHVDSTDLFAPEVCFHDAERHLPEILRKHGRAEEVAPALGYLNELRRVILPVPEDVYLEHQAAAHARIELRDPDDWPVVAAALALECPIWTEDHDFFGTGLATWTTDRVELYLNPAE